MLVLRSTHEKLLKAERDRCDAVLAQMREQIADLRKLVFVPEASHAQEHPIRLANAILDGQEVMPDESEKREEEMREANRILSGEYSNVEESW